MDLRAAFLLVIWSLLTVVNAAENLAFNKPTNQSSTYDSYSSSKAVDGCANQYRLSGCCIHTDHRQDYKEVWWQVDLLQQSVIKTVKIIYRNETNLQQQRLAGFELYLSNTSDWTSGIRFYKDNTLNEGSMALVLSIACPNVARYVTIYNDRRIKTYPWYSDVAILELCEVYVDGCAIGKYGNGSCNQDCLNCRDDKCHPTSGVCECKPRYYGDRCDQACPQNCMQDTGGCTTVDTPREGDGSLNIPAIGIGIGSGVVILALVIALIVQARRHQLRHQQDTQKPIKDINLRTIGLDSNSDTDGAYEAIDAIESEPSTVGTSIEVNNYECLRSSQREAPHLYDTT